MKLPLYEKGPSRKRERKQLAQWLAERELDGLLDHAVPSAERVVRYDEKEPVGKAGEIYVLKPVDVWTPVYVVLLEEANGGKWLAVPFGRYATPAVPGEWRTGLSVMPLRVLCFWNTREIGADRLVDGPAKRLSTRQIEGARSVYRHVVLGKTAEARTIERLGPPILHPADPRYAYLEEERVRLDDHISKQAGSLISFNEEKTNWLMAAEGRPGYGKRNDE